MLLLLDATTKSIEAASSSGPTDITFVTAYSDSTSNSFTEGSSDGTVSTVDTTVVAAPAASTRRVIKSINFYNTSGSARTVTLKYNNNGTKRIIAVFTLATGENWSTDDLGGGGTSSLTVGSTPITGTNGSVLFVNGSVLGEIATTGSGNLVRATSPTLTTPNLGTPSAATLTNATGLPLSTGVTGTLPVANGGTGVTTSTGSGSNVLSTSPTLTTPNLGTPSAATLTNATGLPLSTGVTGTLSVSNGGTGASSLTANNVLLGNGTSAVQVVPPGANGNVLTSNGTTWTSAAPTGGGGAVENLLINGGFDWARRQVPGTLTARANDSYCADRWYVLHNGGPTDIQYARTAGDTNSEYSGQLKQVSATSRLVGIAQIVESANSIPLSGKSATFQARIKASSSMTMRMAILAWTGTADNVTSNIVNNWASTNYTAGNFFNSANVSVVSVSPSLSVSTSFAGFSITGTMSSSIRNAIVFLWAESAMSQNVTFDITQAGLYASASALEEWSPRPDIAEDALCLAYCQPLVDVTLGTPQPLGVWGIRFNEIIDFAFRLPVVMRGAPTLVLNSATFKSGGQPTDSENLFGALNVSIGSFYTVTNTAIPLGLAASNRASVNLRLGIFNASYGLNGSTGNMSALIFGGITNVYLEAEL